MVEYCLAMARVEGSSPFFRQQLLFQQYKTESYEGDAPQKEVYLWCCQWQHQR